MSLSTRPPDLLPVELDSLLAKLRRRVRAYVWLDGVATALVWLGAWFWLGLAVDWLMEPEQALRMAGMAVAAAGLGVILYRKILRRALVPLSRSSLAVILERHCRQFGDRLVTVVELAGQSRDDPGRWGSAELGPQDSGAAAERFASPTGSATGIVSGSAATSATGVAAGSATSIAAGSTATAATGIATGSATGIATVSATTSAAAPAGARFSPEMLAYTASEAIARAADVRLRRVFNLRPLVTRLAAATALAASVAALGVLNSSVLAFYLDRLAGSPEPWPRETLLVADSFVTEFAVVADQLAISPTGAGQSEDAAPAAVVHVHRGAVEVASLRRGLRRDQRNRCVAAGQAMRVGSRGEDEPFAPTAVSPPTDLFAALPENLRPSGSNGSEGIGVLRRAHQAMWRDGSNRAPGARLERGRYALAHGTVELLLDNGVTIRCEGPAEFVLRSSRLVELERGRLEASVPARRAQFAVRLADATVTAVRNGTVKITRGSDITLTARADVLKQVPELVEIRYRTAAGDWGREIMRQESVAVPGRDEYQRYTFTFQNVLASIDFELVGGDDRISGLRIEAVDPPRLLETAAQVRYPSYLQGAAMPAALLPIAGSIELPEGSGVTLRATASRPLTAVEIVASNREQPIVLPLGGREGQAAGSSFTVPLGRLDRSVQLGITLRDADGIANREPIPLELVVRPDEPPRLAVRLRGIGTAVTPQAALAIEGSIDDDHGLGEAWFSLARGEEPPTRHRIELHASGGRSVAFAARPDGQGTSGRQPPQRRGTAGALPAQAAALDLRQLLAAGEPVRPGDRLIVSVKAADRCDLRAEPNVGESDRYHLEVVTPEELLSRLESRELVLRQKFETIIEELEWTRDMLVGLPAQSSGNPPGGDDQPGEAPGGEGDAAGGTASNGAASNGAASDGAVSDGAASDGAASDGAESAAAGSSREGGARGAAAVGQPGAMVERVAQNCERSAHETAGVAAGFEDIRLELVSNRLDTAERVARLREEVAEPLRRIVDDRFPVLQAKLALLRQAVRPAPGAVEASEVERLTAEARTEADRILADMNQVLQRMLKMEDYNEIIELLRELIRQQEELNSKTIKKQRDDLLN